MAWINLALTDQSACLVKKEFRNARVLKDLEPFVVFANFGDNALIFETHFWISIRRVIERRLIESSVRFRVDVLFREAGIVIAFPQRDVHLDTLRPLEFRFTSSKLLPEEKWIYYLEHFHPPFLFNSRFQYVMCDSWGIELKIFAMLTAFWKAQKLCITRSILQWILIQLNNEIWQVTLKTAMLKIFKICFTSLYSLVP